MNGRRRRGVEPHEFEAGDYGRWERADDNWYACCPDGSCANLTSHEVTEHEDGTITVTPSILVSTMRNGEKIPLWHGFLERGVWRLA
jgi:hypothetical protein